MCKCKEPCHCNDNSHQEDRLECFCIKELRLSIKSISKDIFQIHDFSEPVSIDYSSNYDETYKAEITGPGKFKVEIEVPINGMRSYSLKELKIGCCMKDGVYCVKVFSCGDWLTINVPHFPDLKCTLSNLVVQGHKSAEELQNKFSMIEQMSEYGQFEEMQKIYKNIKNVLKSCSV